MKGQKFESLRFAFAGGITGFLFVLISEIVLWITFIPVYSQLMVNLYGVSNTSGILRGFSIALIIGFIFSFFLSWVFAKAYNKLLMLKVK